MHKLKEKVKKHAHVHQHHHGRKHQARGDVWEDTYHDSETVIGHQLAKLGLKIKDMTGDGNCLFRSLSDQFDGTPHNHAKQREIVCDHLIKHPDVYAPFVDLDGEGSFEQHVSRMRRDGTYGGNMEVVAFARARNVDIAVHQAGEPVWVVSGEPLDGDGQPHQSSTTERRTLHIVYHSWEHYSSVRNISGPMDGLPNISIVPTELGPLPKQDPAAPPTKMEQAVIDTTGVDDIARIRDLMTKFKGNPNRAIDFLYREGEKILEDDIGPLPDQYEHSPSKVSSSDVETTAEFTAMEKPAVIAEAKASKPHQRPKRVSARDRKEAARRARKENAMARKAGKVNGGSHTVLAPQGVDSSINGVVDTLKAIRI